MTDRLHYGTPAKVMHWFVVALYHSVSDWLVRAGRPWRSARRSYDAPYFVRHDDPGTDCVAICLPDTYPVPPESSLERLVNRILTPR
jgi:hypothetical protein